MSFLRYLVLSFFIYQVSFAQLEKVKKINIPDEGFSIENSCLLSNSDSLFGLVWQAGNKIYSATSSNYGETWENITTLSESVSEEFDVDLCSANLNDGRTIISYKVPGKKIVRISNDNGLSWSDEILINIPGTLTDEIRHSHIAQLQDGSVWISFSSGRVVTKIYYVKSSDGLNWSETRKTLLTDNARPDFPILMNDKDNNLVLIYQSNIDRKKIFRRISSDDGLTWSDAELFFESPNPINRPRIIQGTNDSLFLSYEDIYFAYNNVGLSKIKVCSTTDLGNSWSQSIDLTSYSGVNYNHNIAEFKSKIICVFASQRKSKFNFDNSFNGFEDSTRIFISDTSASSLYISQHGAPGKEITSPYFVYANTSTSPNGDTDYSRTLEVKVVDNLLKEVVLRVAMPNYLYQTDGYLMKDDGLFPDKIAGDSVYSVSIDGISLYDGIQYFITAENNLGGISTTELISDLSSTVKSKGEIETMNINKLQIPVSNNGNIADIDPGNGKGPGGRFEEDVFLFSGGFFLSGFDNNSLWANGVHTASQINDYIPGKAGSNSGNWYNRLYSIDKNDVPFGESWLLWKSAVDYNGADFYDGDMDGIYLPEDKNSNGQWDADEDKPILYGDKMLWCVFNDGLPAKERRFNQNPKGVEIKQTTWAYNPETYRELENVLFIKYEISNTGAVNDLLEDVYFSVATDADLGNYDDDHIGCDTLLNSSYYYNDGTDMKYGANCPAFFTTILQGPHTYQPGVSYKDNNENSVYDNLIDTPLDTAEYRYGDNRNSQQFIGATNLGMKSFFPFYQSHPTQGNPNTQYEIRNYMIGGRYREGAPVSPCDVIFGEFVGNYDCATANNNYFYSGDPVNRLGWISKESLDQRSLQSMGPFKLRKSEPVEIIVAYSVGRGIDQLNSITVGKSIVENTIGFYETNFSKIPVSVSKDENSGLPNSYRLSQNYPNPFNPSTVIEYSIPENSEVKLQVFDILGREVTTLINQNQAAGNYKYSFNAEQLASGVYFYKLTAVSSEGNKTFSKTSKMMLLR